MLCKGKNIDGWLSISPSQKGDMPVSTPLNAENPSLEDSFEARHLPHAKGDSDGRGMAFVKAPAYRSRNTESVAPDLQPEDGNDPQVSFGQSQSRLLQEHVRMNGSEAGHELDSGERNRMYRGYNLSHADLIGGGRRHLPVTARSLQKPQDPGNERFGQSVFLRSSSAQAVLGAERVLSTRHTVQAGTQSAFSQRAPEAHPSLSSMPPMASGGMGQAAHSIVPAGPKSYKLDLAASGPLRGSFGVLQGALEAQELKTQVGKPLRPDATPAPWKGAEHGAEFLADPTAKPEHVRQEAPLQNGRGQLDNLPPKPALGSSVKLSTAPCLSKGACTFQNLRGDTEGSHLPASMVPSMKRPDVAPMPGTLTGFAMPTQPGKVHLADGSRVVPSATHGVGLQSTVAQPSWHLTELLTASTARSVVRALQGAAAAATEAARTAAGTLPDLTSGKSMDWAVSTVRAGASQHGDRAPAAQDPGRILKDASVRARQGLLQLSQLFANVPELATEKARPLREDEDFSANAEPLFTGPERKGSSMQRDGADELGKELVVPFFHGTEADLDPSRRLEVKVVRRGVRHT